MNDIHGRLLEETVSTHKSYRFFVIDVNAKRKGSYRTWILALALLMAQGAAPNANAQRLFHTATTPGISTTSTLAGGTGAYAGTVSTIATNILDGGAVIGVPGVAAQNFTNLTPKDEATLLLQCGMGGH
jgi:hypothetical protein